MAITALVSAWPSCGNVTLRNVTHCPHWSLAGQGQLQRGSGHKNPSPSRREVKPSPARHTHSSSALYRGAIFRGNISLNSGQCLSPGFEPVKWNFVEPSTAKSLYGKYFCLKYALMMSIECSELLWPAAAEAVWGTCVHTGPRRQFPVEAVSSARPPVSSSRLRQTPAGRG